MMARSDLLHARAGYRSARPTTSVLKIQLATRGRSIQMGQKRRICDVRFTSALSSASDVSTPRRYRRFGPHSDSCRAVSFDDLIGELLELRRDIEAECRGSFEVNHEIE